MYTSELKEIEYNGYYSPYINAVSGKTIGEALLEGREVLKALLEVLDEDKMRYSYASGKWTIAELLLHLIDTERIFQYRALRFARRDSTDLPGFEQDDYVLPSKANGRSKASIISEYDSVRNASIELFKNFDDEMLISVGTANGSPMSVRAIGFVISGHQQHHLNILSERYL